MIDLIIFILQAFAAFVFLLVTIMLTVRIVFSSPVEACILRMRDFMRGK